MKSIVHNTDCLPAMRAMPDKCFDLAIVDVPYGIKESLNNNASRGKARGGLNNSAMGWSRDYGKKEWDRHSPDAQYFTELRRVTCNQIVFGANHFISKLPFDSSCWIVWDKDNGQNDFADCELAWTSLNSAVRKIKIRWHGLFQEDMANKERRIHPTQKPVALYKWLLTNYAKEGQSILDTHMGSQSSRIACWDLGFNYCGFEIDEDYFKAGCERFENHCAQPKLFAPVETIEQQEGLFS